MSKIWPWQKPVEPTPEFIESESANAWSHGLAFLAVLISLPFFFSAVQWESFNRSIVIGVYVGCLLLMLLSSTLFHGFKFTIHGKKLMILDHIAIYAMIAGTYTALLYRYINTDSGQILMIILWVITAVGSLFKIFFAGKWDTLSGLFYLFMASLIFFIFPEFLSSVPVNIQHWIYIGGGAYVVGLLVYFLNHIPYNHLAWHFFVIGGAFSHYYAIYMAYV